MKDLSKLSVRIAVDLGASSGRLIAGWLHEGCLETEVIHRFENNPVRVAGSLQWNLTGLWSEILRGLSLSASRCSEIESIGVDSWGVDFGWIDSCGQLAGPVYHYRDDRTAGMMEHVDQTVGFGRVFDTTGIQFMPINSIYQICGAVARSDSALSSAESFLMIADLFHYWLCGIRSIEVTNASTTQLLDAQTQQWDTELINALEIPSQPFAAPIAPATRLGQITDEVKTETGLTGGEVIVPATHDTASAVIAVPAEPGEASSQPKWCYISSGTWSLMGVEIDKPIINEKSRSLNFTNEAGINGTTRLVKNIGGLWIFQQLRRSMIRRGVERDWSAMVEMASKAEPFSAIIHPDHPDLIAPSDMWSAACKVAAFKGPPINPDTPVDEQMEGRMYRAALEGLALRYRECLQLLESLVGGSIETIHIVGGGCVNELLCEMTADACNRKVVAGPDEATSLGNLLVQLIGGGQVADLSAARQIVRDSIEVRTYLPREDAGRDAAAYANVVLPDLPS
ncbi:MAG: rhamnulokinase family protein [Planctomycetota bacterium]